MDSVISSYFKRSVLFFICFIILSSCSKISYVVEQGVGQISLLNRAVDNKEVLSDVKINKSYKRKIRLVEKYKKYFYNYFSREITEIYSKTTILDGDAVSFLVVASPFYKIKAIKECFLFVGCFPYLGFFEKKSARKYAENLKKQGFDTYMRPVYAYSTLGHFTDTILSSFFHYNDYQLAELVFHELFHTVFFVDDEVELNENLANYFGKQMAQEYFKVGVEELKRKERAILQNHILRKFVLKSAKELNQNYSKAGGKKISRDTAQGILDNYLSKTLIPRALKLCKEQKISKKRCYPVNRKWNNASLAAYITYEKKMDRINQLRESKKFDLKELLIYIEKKFKSYENEDVEGKFSDYLL